MLPRHAVVLLVQADRVADHRRLARGVVQHGVHIGDLAQAVAAQLQRRGHEAQAPLADVERGAVEVVRRGVAVGHHHLREREPVRDRSDARSVGPPHLVQHQALAVGEPQPHPPVLPRQRVPVEGERRALGLDDLQRPQRGARGVARDVRGGVLPHHLREAGVRPVLDLQQLHGVHVDHELEPGHRVGVRVAPRGAAQPHVAPADPAARERLGDQGGPVGPHVDQGQRRIVDPALGQRRDHVGVAAHRLVALVPLVDGRVGLAARLGFPCQQGVIGPRQFRPR